MNLKFSIAIPGSVVSDVPHPREKTLKIGLIARAAAVFCVDEIILFPDFQGVSQRREMSQIATILSYIETPQYLKKRLFKIRPELRYAGILPPLRTPHHPLSNRVKDLVVGEYREGVVVSSKADGSLVDIGLERPILSPSTQIPLDTRITIRITEIGEDPKAVLAKREEIQTYWGYQVTVLKEKLGHFLNKHRFDLVIATSRHGNKIIDLMDELSTRSKKSRNILLAFGAPNQGLHEIISHEQLQLSEVTDFIINFIPSQGTETVRTEEALYSSLAILNLLVDVRH